MAAVPRPPANPSTKVLYGIAVDVNDSWPPNTARPPGVPPFAKGGQGGFALVRPYKLFLTLRSRMLRTEIATLNSRPGPVYE